MKAYSRTHTHAHTHIHLRFSFVFINKHRICIKERRLRHKRIHRQTNSCAISKDTKLQKGYTFICATRNHQHSTIHTHYKYTHTSVNHIPYTNENVMIYDVYSIRRSRIFSPATWYGYQSYDCVVALFMVALVLPAQGGRVVEGIYES